MIDEKKLIETIVNTPSKHQDDCCLEFLKGMATRQHEILDIIKEETKADWIPCEVQLPPKPRFSEDSYLVKTQCVTTPYTAYWNGEKWTDVLDDDIEDVIAWCQIPPYPQPYKKEGESDAEKV